MTAPIVAIQMDPPHRLNPKGDSTIALGLEAQRRGYRLFCYTPDTLSYDQGGITARGEFACFTENPNHWYDAEKSTTLDLREARIILLRQDPPFDMAYITTTYLLERLQNHGVLVVNNPRSVRDCPEKWLVTEFADFIPPTLISADPQALTAFKTQHRDVVIKPLYGHGGNAVFRLGEHDGNFNALVEYMLAKSPEPVIAQAFLPEVKNGDIRVILADGQFAGAVRRMPGEGEIRSNFRVGGTGAVAELTDRQNAALAAIAPVLKEKGLIFAGLDLIGDYVTEINVTSPTGLRNIRDLSGIQPEMALWDAIEARL